MSVIVTATFTIISLALQYQSKLNPTLDGLRFN